MDEECKIKAKDCIEACLNDIPEAERAWWKMMLPTIETMLAFKF